ncbi:hypothetical protein AVEN_263058-1 [Araneus ventricosus]|uniref:Uncharacterized protein n=1 Tax=Araneus ventricosus TaxID=182803 RepID=A0A4Y2KJR5_ARAVE|nr:hypothetical protein AVEN_263058-1 [Araneus ventricosus]
MARRGCVISPNNFCFICGEYTVKSQQKQSDLLKKFILLTSGSDLGDQRQTRDLWVWCLEDVGKDVVFCGLRNEKTPFSSGISMMCREEQTTLSLIAFFSVR